MRQSSVSGSRPLTHQVERLGNLSSNLQSVAALEEHEAYGPQTRHQATPSDGKIIEVFQSTK